MKESTILMKNIVRYENMVERLGENRSTITLKLNDDNDETRKFLIEFFTKKKFDATSKLKKILKV